MSTPARQPRRRPAQRETKAGDWFAARQAGKRLPEHLFDEELEAALATQQQEQTP